MIGTDEPQRELQIDIDRSETVSDGAWDVNEDIVTVRQDGAWVLDGATGLGDATHTPGKSDGQWYVEQFDAHLRDRIHDTESPLKEIVRQGIERLTREFQTYHGGQDLDDAHRPSATCAICRLNGRVLEVLVLGDCSVFLSRTDGSIERVYDDRLDSLDAEVAAEIKRLVTEEGLSILEAREKCLSLLRTNRRKKNTDNGYWALGMDPRASTEAITEQFTVMENDTVFGMTDGFGALVDTYEQFPSWTAAIETLADEGLTAGIDWIREAEEEDPECVQYPRTKPEDDATAFRALFRQRKP
jgi:serine/threonine protein phosphatase PrpC